MEEKITRRLLNYPVGYEPDLIVPETYCSKRFILGKKGNNPLVVICMNPSAAREDFSDATINRIIKISKKLGMDGWVVLNTYPERATDKNNLEDFDKSLSDKNVQEIIKFIKDNHIKEVWGAWGDGDNIDALKKGKLQLIDNLDKLNVGIFYFGTLTKNGNPRHPLQRFEKWDFKQRHYLKNNT